MSSFSACCAVLPAAVLFKFNQSRPSQKEVGRKRAGRRSATAAAGAANNGQQKKKSYSHSRAVKRYRSVAGSATSHHSASRPVYYISLLCARPVSRKLCPSV